MYIHPSDDRYGAKVGGYRYKKWRPPEPLGITILKMVGLGVAFTTASILSPTFLLNAIKAYLKYKYDEAKYYDYLDKKRIQGSLRYLKRKNFIAFPAKSKKGQFVVTRSGEGRLAEIELRDIKEITKPVSWDGKWRLVTFDIPEEKSGKRHIFRRKLKELGFYHFQRSVFLLPYPCEKEVNRMKEILEIENNAHLLVTDSFDGDEELLKRYNPKFFSKFFKDSTGGQK